MWAENGSEQLNLRVGEGYWNLRDQGSKMPMPFDIIHTYSEDMMDDAEIWRVPSLNKEVSEHQNKSWVKNGTSKSINLNCDNKRELALLHTSKYFQMYGEKL